MRSALIHKYNDAIMIIRIEFIGQLVPSFLACREIYCLFCGCHHHRPVQQVPVRFLDLHVHVPVEMII